MGNCLVTKLKESVNNNSLYKLGTAVFYVNQSETAVTYDQQQVNITIIAPVTLTITGGSGYINTNYDKLNTEQKTKITLTEIGVNTVYVTNGTFTVEAFEKYNISYITIFVGAGKTGIITVDLDSLSWCQNLLGINILRGKVIGNLSSLEKSENLHALILRADDAKVYGKYSSLQNINLTTVECQTQLNLSGELADFGESYNLVTCNVYTRTIHGSIESFVQKQVVGRTTTSRPISFSGISGITFGGNVIDSDLCALEWDTYDKIVAYIGDGGKASSSTVMAKGATAEEIAAWEGAGRTVVVIS